MGLGGSKTDHFAGTGIKGLVLLLSVRPIATFEIRKERNLTLRSESMNCWGVEGEVAFLCRITFVKINV